MTRRELFSLVCAAVVGPRLSLRPFRRINWYPKRIMPDGSIYPALRPNLTINRLEAPIRQVLLTQTNAQLDMIQAKLDAENARTFWEAKNASQ